MPGTASRTSGHISTSWASDQIRRCVESSVSPGASKSSALVPSRLTRCVSRSHVRPPDSRTVSR